MAPDNTPSPQINQAGRNNYWNTFSAVKDRGELWYHLAGADKAADSPGGTVAPADLLYYVYRFSYERNVLRSAVETYCPRRDRALDCGTGTGRNAVLLAEYFERVSAFDISRLFIGENRIRFARIRNLDFFISDFSGLKTTPGAYDLIFVGGVCMYLSEAEMREALRLAASALRPDGVLVLRDSVTPAVTREHEGKKIYRSEADYERIITGEGFAIRAKANGAKRNLWCSLFRRLPAWSQERRAVWRVFSFLTRLTSGGVNWAQPFRRHPLANQLFYVCQPL
ncbi:MAG: hypothetical protein UY92_C0007G0010 [Candidatus Magasanikbacteria bacterium GW2011_GWA2_56_11]|uniref:Alpha N-terminal protein methyltransferase 1 n=1 Tax=Candidatus Magasanikbacteria bacterium GW2011_GWA2_56_11 TaxID=1619044 RepID=A0A0G1YGL0_9BACT|nr:MAG: hypothetical protein UY92_C0007G0010 [Candidatus Magasanikbacteria bacterium GW2011_GWA2_56_11]